MTSDRNQTPTLLDDNIDEDEEDETEEEEEEEEEEEDLTTNNILIEENDDDLTTAASDPTLSVTIALSPPISTTPKLINNVNDPIKITPISSQPPGSDDQARKLFQRLWTDEDEIGLLQGFLDYSTQRGTSQNNPHDTALFYDQIKSKLQLDFNKNQLVEKLRRLKKKYRNVLARISSGKEVSFKSAHDQSTFEIACKIWGTATAANSSKDHQVNLQQHSFNPQLLQRRIDVVDDDMPPNYNSSGTNTNLNFATSGSYNSGHYNDRVAVDERRVQHKSSKKRSRERVEDARVMMDQMGGTVPASSSHVQIPIWGSGVGLSTPLMTDEKAKIKISPLLREMYEGSGGRGFADGIVSPVPLSFASPMNMFGVDGVDDRWRKQQILELEVYSKRLVLVQEQIKLTLEQLRSTGN